MPRTKQPELLLDARLVHAAVWAPAALAAPAAALGGLADGAPGAFAALWGIAAVGLTAYAAAAVSARGGRTSRGIGVVRVTAMVPLRLLLVAVALYVGVGPLGFPSRILALAVCAGEIGVLSAQSWLVVRGLKICLRGISIGRAPFIKFAAPACSAHSIHISNPLALRQRPG